METSVEEVDTNILRIMHHFDKSRDDQWYCLMSDLHWDHPQCDRGLLVNHLKEARRRNARILLNGDSLCLMQGKRDKRHKKSSVRPEHFVDNYYEKVALDFAKFLRPYGDLIDLIGYGNHETAVTKFLEFDPLALAHRELQRLNSDYRGQLGGYGGWVVFSFKDKTGTNICSRKLHYFHGSGGGGPVTKNAIQHQRQNAFVEDADFIWNGHVHELWTMVVRKLALSSNKYEHVLKSVKHIQTGTYKEELRFRKGGWAVEKGMPPKPLGCAFLRFRPIKIRKDNSNWRLNTTIELLDEEV